LTLETIKQLDLLLLPMEQAAQRLGFGTTVVRHPFPGPRHAKESHSARAHSHAPSVQAEAAIAWHQALAGPHDEGAPPAAQRPAQRVRPRKATFLTHQNPPDSQSILSAHEFLKAQIVEKGWRREESQRMLDTLNKARQLLINSPVDKTVKEVERCVAEGGRGGSTQASP
jgi:hypothetical protein